MLGIREILFTAAVVAGIWLVFRWFSRVQKLRAHRAMAEKRQDTGKSTVEDLVACQVCDVYGAPNAAACERGDCPRR